MVRVVSNPAEPYNLASGGGKLGEMFVLTNFDSGERGFRQVDFVIARLPPDGARDVNLPDKEPGRRSSANASEINPASIALAGFYSWGELTGGLFEFTGRAVLFPG